MSTVQKGLGAYVHKSQTIAYEVQQMVREANAILAFIARGLKYISGEVLLYYIRIVRSIGDVFSLL